ncbi:MAG: acetyl-CoA carboxylase, carboxyltransferase subunit beta [Alphaproteobacteria bacterium]|nr:acetyl-CoA carboxylase, carboxyltransferase subunit beta [Alphaproteobacteria bacterium]
MSWLTNFVRPKIQALVGKKDVPDNLWHRCPSCDQMLFHRELTDNLHVCHHCDCHMRISATARLDLLFDDGEYARATLPEVTTDPLKFRDTKRYTERLREAEARTSEPEAIVVASGQIGGLPAVIAAFDFAFMGGSMGQAVGEGMVVAARLACDQDAALIAIPASGGARMQEGVLSLIQMPRTVIAVEQVREAGLPYIVILTDPTTGGVSASFAMLGDIQIAEPGAMIGFAGRRVIEDTIREELPEDFQRAERLLDHGLVDMVVARRDLRPTLIRVLSILRQKTPTDLEPKLAATVAPDGEADVDAATGE